MGQKIEYSFGRAVNITININKANRFVIALKEAWKSVLEPYGITLQGIALKPEYRDQEAMHVSCSKHPHSLDVVIWPCGKLLRYSPFPLFMQCQAMITEQHGIRQLCLAAACKYLTANLILPSCNEIRRANAALLPAWSGPSGNTSKPAELLSYQPGLQF